MRRILTCVCFLLFWASPLHAAQLRVENNGGGTTSIIAPGTTSVGVLCEPGLCLPEEFCGDGIIQTGAGEECDDGSLNSDTRPDACRTDCTLASCGDGVVDTGEECDDGNSVDDDACGNDCTLPVCGNGICEPGEEISCPEDCPQPTSACCLDDGACTVVSLADCEILFNGVFLPGIPCEPNPCPQPTGGLLLR